MAINKNAELRKELRIPDGFNPLLSIAFGYGDNPNEKSKEHKIITNKT
jgi:hypothetical protein